MTLSIAQERIMDKRIKLYRRRDDGSLEMTELSPRSFSCRDDFLEALDCYYERGFSEEVPERAVA